VGSAAKYRRRATDPRMPNQGGVSVEDWCEGGVCCWKQKKGGEEREKVRLGRVYSKGGVGVIQKWVLNS